MTMSDAVTTDPIASRGQVLAQRARLATLARRSGLSDAAVDAAGVVVVHSNAPGYAAVRRFASAASVVVGAWVNVITDDVPAAQVPTEAL
jgi:hypothetical protein